MSSCVTATIDILDLGLADDGVLLTYVVFFIDLIQFDHARIARFLVELLQRIHYFLLLILNAWLLLVDSWQARRLIILILLLTVTVLAMVRQVSVLIGPASLRSFLFDRRVWLLRLLEVVVIGAWQFLLEVCHVLDMIVSDFNPLAIREEDRLHEFWLPLADRGLHATAISRR